jgi:hypothetical protein
MDEFTSRSKEMSRGVWHHRGVSLMLLLASQWEAGLGWDFFQSGRGGITHVL